MKKQLLLLLLGVSVGLTAMFSGKGGNSKSSNSGNGSSKGSNTKDKSSNTKDKDTRSSVCKVVTGYLPTKEVIDHCRNGNKSGGGNQSGHGHTRNREKRN